MRSVEFGNFLKLHRKRLNLSQQELANRWECSHSTIVRLESGKQYPSRRLFMKLCQEFEYLGLLYEEVRFENVHSLKDARKRLLIAIKNRRSEELDRALEQFHAYMKDDNVERDEQEIVDNQQYYELGQLIAVKKNGLGAEDFLAQLIHVFEIRRPLPSVEDLSVLKLSQIEYQLLFEMGEAYSLMGDTDRAEAIYKALLANRIDSRCSFVKEKYMEMSFIMAKLSIVKKDYETANKCLTYVFNEFLTASDTRLLYNSFFLQEEICGMAGDVIGTQVLHNFIQATQELMNHMLGKYRLDQ